MGRGFLGLVRHMEVLQGPIRNARCRRGSQENEDPDETLECAVTNTNGPVLSRDNIKSDIDKWCDSLDGKIISQDDTHKENVKSFGSSKVGSKLTDLVYSDNWIKNVKGEGCPDRTRGTEPKHCKKAPMEVVAGCGIKDGMDGGSPRYGGSQQGDEQCACIFRNRKVSKKATLCYDSTADQWVDSHINSEKDHILWARYVYLSLFYMICIPRKVDQTFGGNKDIGLAWDTWGVDKLATLRNADGHVGEPKTDTGILSNLYDLHYFFSIPVLKHICSDVPEGSIWIAGDVPGQEKSIINH
ncbi:hypothetical protein ACHAPA_009650 [Fusarium lateritium]